MIDWFADEWQREEDEADAARTRARRSAQVARVRRRAPIAATIAAAAAIVAFAGVAAARLIGQRASTWTASAGSVVTQGDARVSSTKSDSGTAPSGPSIAFAASAYQRGDAMGALRILSALRVSDSSNERFVADSLIALAAMRGTEDELSAGTPSTDALQLVVATTSMAIARAHPGTAVLAPLSLARAGACVGGRLNCPAEQVREDLAWALLLGSVSEQDEARRLRAALLDDSLTIVR